MVIGLILVLTIKPGAFATVYLEKEDTHGLNENSTSKPDNIRPERTRVDVVLDLLRNAFPPNLVQATFKQYRTKLEKPKPNVTVEGDEVKVHLDPRHTWEFQEDHWDENTNILGLVVWSCAIGLAAAQKKHESRPFIKFFEALREIMMARKTLIM